MDHRQKTSQAPPVLSRNTLHIRPGESLAPVERRTLELYRRAGGRLLERMDPYAHFQWSYQFPGHETPGTVKAIPEAEFIALLTAFRVVYATGERTNFARVANIVWRVGSDEVRRLVALFREDWKDVPKRPYVVDFINGPGFWPGDILEAWCNGEVFHQEEMHVRHVDMLRGLDPFPEIVLQLTVRDMSFAALGLDNMCAAVLG